jgi:hypothetical protein
MGQAAISFDTAAPDACSSISRDYLSWVALVWLQCTLFLATKFLARRLASSPVGPIRTQDVPERGHPRSRIRILKAALRSQRLLDLGRAESLQ